MINGIVKICAVGFTQNLDNGVIASIFSEWSVAEWRKIDASAKHSAVMQQSVRSPLPTPCMLLVAVRSD